jgi:alkylated DNA repair dioxygenase AlkB
VRQQELFPSIKAGPEVPTAVDGFRLQLDYLTQEEEAHLIAQIDAQTWQTDYRRRIQQYGFGYTSGSGEAPVWLRDFPAWLQPLAERVSRDAFTGPAENCVINEYIPPQGIGSHRDYETFGPVVACVSLGSDIVMDFTQPEDKLRIPVLVPARSFWVISGEARSNWLHGIARRFRDEIAGEKRFRARRISITFRTLATK